MALLTTSLVGLLVLLLVGSWVYCVLTAIAARRYLATSPPALKTTPPISVLKPLCGQDDCLEENLRSFFTQDYPDYEILFAVHTLYDPAVAVVKKYAVSFLTGRKYTWLKLAIRPRPMQKPTAWDIWLRAPSTAFWL